MRLLTVSSRVAGAPMQFIKDLNLDEGGLVHMLQAADDELRKMGVRDSSTIVWEAMARAAAKAMPGALEKIPKWAQPGGNTSPEALVHEMEHLVLDPAFDLISGEKPGNHPVEASMDEALTAGMAGYTDEIAEGGYEPSEKFLRGDAATVGETLDRIKSAPVSTREKKRIRDAAYSDLERALGKYRDRPLDEDADLEQAVTPNCRRNAPWITQISVIFLDGVVKRYAHWKDVMAEGMEDVWRRFVLNAKNELRKAVKAQRADEL